MLIGYRIFFVKSSVAAKIMGTRTAVTPQRFVLNAAGPAAQSSFVSSL